MTVRHLFYRMVAAGAVDKTELEYSNTVARYAVELRRSGAIPYGKIVDGSRLYTAPTTYDDVADALADTAALYRRSYWRDAAFDLEVWCEKDAIRGLIQDVTWKLAVPLMITRGFASESVVQTLALETKESGKPRVILALNDHDPSGSIMAQGVIDRAKHYAPKAIFHLRQVALTRAQVDAYNLPTRPTKLEGNRHAKNFQGESVELDAMAPDLLRRLLTDAIEQFIDPKRLAIMNETEASERAILNLMSTEYDEDDWTESKPAN